MIDYQMHTVNSDGTSTVDGMIKAAEKIGLKEICITDHFSPHGDTNQLTGEKLPRYFKEIESAGKDHLIKVRIGLEVEYYEELETQIERALSELQWDLVLGSVHRVGGLEIGDNEFYSSRSQLEAYTLYFDKWRKAVESRLFDVMAHPDYVRRWAVPFYERELEFATYENQLIEPLRYMAKNRIGFEVNCGGLRRREGITYPSVEFVTLARNQGVEIVTISSDAHSAEDLSILFLSEDVSVLKKAGFDQVYTFNRRKPSPIPIDRLY
jgi:histidinol-phosphatase (PHP family)